MNSNLLHSIFEDSVGKGILISGCCNKGGSSTAARQSNFPSEQAVMFTDNLDTVERNAGEAHQLLVRETDRSGNIIMTSYFV